MLGHVIHRFVQGDAQHTDGQGSGDKFSCDTHRPSQGRALPQEDESGEVMHRFYG